VHDHNLFDQSVDNGVQNGFKSFHFEVETAPGIGDELVVRVRFLEVRLLPGKVFSLMSRGDACVDNPLELLRGRFNGIFTKKFSQMSDVVQSFALVTLETHVAESFAVRPGTESLLVNCVCALDVTG
jgi:hypothetical protein